jgi:hypothetical protein
MTPNPAATVVHDGFTTKIMTLIFVLSAMFGLSTLAATRHARIASSDQIDHCQLRYEVFAA